VAWARDLYNQCREADVPFFYKQGSALLPERDDLLDGVQVHQWPM
jgi:protein gp37